MELLQTNEDYWRVDYETAKELSRAGVILVSVARVTETGLIIYDELANYPDSAPLLVSCLAYFEAMGVEMHYSPIRQGIFSAFLKMGDGSRRAIKHITSVDERTDLLEFIKCACRFKLGEEHSI